MLNLRRRQFMTLLGGAAAAWPLAARAQQPAMRVVGYFSGRSPEAEAPILGAFRKGLEETGYLAGQNIAIEFRFSDGQDDQLPALAAELVRQRVAVLVATDRPSAAAAKAATSTIPIVFASGLDAVELGLVASLNRPGGNATGVNIFTTELGPKRLELLRQLLPNAGTIAFIVNPNNATTGRQVSELQTAAAALGQQILVLNAGSENEIDEAFATIVERRVAAVLYPASLFFQVRQEQLVALAARHSIPAMYEWREFVTAGGLMSYSTNRAEAFRQIGIYTGRVLKGANPADLPVMQSIRFEFVINLKTAKALGIKISDDLLSLADEVIE
jgi:putative tryptophan/tyrosine transport system substrate-binding protein